MTPTQQAELAFKSAQMEFRNAQENGLLHLAEGLENLSVGLRATYMKLEAIEKLVKPSREIQVEIGRVVLEP